MRQCLSQILSPAFRRITDTKEAGPFVVSCDEREKTGWWVEVGRFLSKAGHSLNSGKSELGICEVFV